MILGRTIWLLAASAAVLSPVLIFWLSGGDFTWVSSESLAYRFFFSARLYRDADVTAWLPQGQVVTAIQHGINYFLLGGLDGSLGNLRSTLNAFCYATLVVIDGLTIAALALAAMARVLTWCDRLALLFVALSPYASSATVQYALWPDYLYLDVALMTAALLFFQFYWRSAPVWPGRVAAFGAGVFVGILAANKISMVMLGIPLVTAIILSSPLRFTLVAQRTALSIVGATLALALLLLASSLFRVDWLLFVFQSWYQFIKNPGGEPGFWRQFWSPSYLGLAVMVLWWVMSFALIARQWSRNNAVLAKIAVVAAIVLSSVLCGFSVWKRPAGTTLWESGASLLAFSGMLLAMTDRSRITRAIVASLSACMTIAIVVARPDLPIRSWAAQSRAIGNEQWSFFEQATKFVPPNGIRYFIPNNHYQAGDPFIILLKGAADILTWNVSKNGQWIIDQFAPGLEFEFESRLRPSFNEKIPDDSIVIWFDFPSLQRIPQLSPPLAEAIGRPGVERITRSLPTARVEGHIARLPGALR